ncbi:GlcG/HbpS family heme-binding protein [Flexivirga meconopsidis]|uniref:GlcG/HbpS family heme-binding protein n=1 Tax=Flexivirga meconopsidis TaxID=2977121 RepID=UPI002240A761|nr:heme-binding protein [Flexivirga meconopsidis]
MTTTDPSTAASTFSTASISTAAAREVIAAAEAEAAAIGVPSVIAVCDAGGILKAFSRMDGAALMSVQVAQDKAYTAAGFGMPTDGWHDFIKDDAPLAAGAPTGIDRLVIFGGGYPIIVNGAVVGAIGVSGGHYAQDMQVARAGLAHLE